MTVNHSMVVRVHPSEPSSGVEILYKRTLRAITRGGPEIGVLGMKVGAISFGSCYGIDRWLTVEAPVELLVRKPICEA